MFTINDIKYPWPPPNSAFDTEGVFDCQGLANYLMTGKIGRIEKDTKHATVTRVFVSTVHEPYTCYKLWEPKAPWVREERGFWGFVHYFTHLQNGNYISKNGCGEVRLFSSFEEMLRKDGFPCGFSTEDNKTTYDINQAWIGQSIVGTIPR